VCEIACVQARLNLKLKSQHAATRYRAAQTVHQ